MTNAISIRLPTADQARAQIPALAAVLLDCVKGGASVTFMASLTPAKAQEYWRGVVESVAVGKTILLVAENEAKRIIGSVQVIHAPQDNQPHRADLAKMLVHREGRRRGAGEKLMRAAEDAARKAGNTLLVLDTVSGSDASRLYERLGWLRVGEIPDYALGPEGGLCPTTYYYKTIA